MCDVLVVEALNATIAELTSKLEKATVAAPDPCVTDLSAAYNTALHIGSVFIILAASFFGVASILIGKFSPALRLPPFAIALGKTFGTGVVLAVALVHLLQPSVVALTGPCVPASISTDYPAYSYLFAMLTALAVQTVEMLANELVPKPSPKILSSTCSTADCAEALTLPRDAADGASSPRDGTDAAELAPPPSGDDSLSLPAEGAPHEHAHKPQHSILSVLAAEFGFTVHSLIIGLAVGVVGSDELAALLVALSFHQFFEGVALGARLLESSFPVALESVLALLFTFSAPIGIGCGVGLMSVGGINTSGETFSLVQGTADAVCAGLMLHISFHLIIDDFPKDVEKGRGGAYSFVKCALMYVALWAGAGIMASLGKFL